MDLAGLDLASALRSCSGVAAETALCKNPALRSHGCLELPRESSLESGLSCITLDFRSTTDRLLLLIVCSSSALSLFVALFSVLVLRL